MKSPYQEHYQSVKRFRSRSVGPDLGLNCLQRKSVDDTIIIVADKIWVEIIFSRFAQLYLKELWPLSHVRISFPHNILRMNGWNLIQFCICIDIDTIQVGIVMRQIVQIYNRVMAFGSSQHFVLA